MTKPHVRGKGFEYRMLYKLKTLFNPNTVKRIPSSGASQEFKGDIWTDDYLIECKKTMHNSYRVTKELMQKIKSEAAKHKRIPLLMFSLNRTQPFVVMGYDTFVKLHKRSEVNE